ncbi:MAG: hypothetical protein WCW30_03845 [Candidatus Gracilibacteria bacterium]|jgi:hypothetical protein
MPKLLLILIALAILIILGLAWVLDHLLVQAKKVRIVEEELVAKMAHRRDIVPYLIESYRGVEKTPSLMIEKIIGKREGARQAKGFHAVWDKEQDLEEALVELFDSVKPGTSVAQDIGWLESRTDIENEWKTLDELEKHLRENTKLLQSRLRRFPFMIFKGMVAGKF